MAVLEGLAIGKQWMKEIMNFRTPLIEELLSTTFLRDEATGACKVVTRTGARTTRANYQNVIKLNVYGMLKTGNFDFS